MAKFGRFAFGQQRPTEEYEGDYMEMDTKKGFVNIFRNEPTVVMGANVTEPRLVVAINLDKGQSVREIK